MLNEADRGPGGPWFIKWWGHEGDYAVWITTVLLWLALNAVFLTAWVLWVLVYKGYHAFR